MKTGLQQRAVTHIISTMCVVRQSTVLIPCTYPDSRYGKLNIGQWVHQRGKSIRVVSRDAFEGRVEFVYSTGGDVGNCSMLLKNVRDSDAGIFSIRFRSLKSGQTWSTSSGVNLSVTDAEVEVISQYDVVTEGDWLVFFCGSCVPSMIVPTYIWRKDGLVYSQNYATNQLDLNSVRLEDAGQFSCVLSGHEGLNSSSVTISVKPGVGNRAAVKKVTVGVISAVFITSVLLVVVRIFLRRKRATSEVQNNTNLQDDKTMKSSEGTYTTLDPKTMSADYDTLDNASETTDNRKP
ncbi:uncharacterized protein [Misgurnus anguillicaudatus]|uniref:uncharacterized protein n=1 Tax=Misgurnus anguillicaudatus TaxID=75329 RepID=UPI003CCEFF1B